MTINGTYSIDGVSLDPDGVGVVRYCLCWCRVRVGWGCHSHRLIMLRYLLLLLLLLDHCKVGLVNLLVVVGGARCFYQDGVCQLLT